MSPEQFGTVRPGDIKYKDVNGDGVITDDDQVPLFAYSGVPQFMYGFGAEVRYKNWTLNVCSRARATTTSSTGRQGRLEIQTATSPSTRVTRATC